MFALLQVNNAGTCHLATIETTDMAEYDTLMNVNVRSVVALTQLCVPHLTVTKGKATPNLFVASWIFQRKNWTDRPKKGLGAKIFGLNNTKHNSLRSFVASFIQ